MKIRMITPILLSIGLVGCSEVKEIKEDVSKVEEKADEVKKEKVRLVEHSNKNEIKYHEEFKVVFTNMSGIMEEITDMYQNMVDDQNLIIDPDFKFSLDQKYEEVSAYCEQVNSSDVPYRLQEVKTLQQVSCNNILDSRDKIKEGLNSLDTEMVMDGVQKAFDSIENLDQANKMMTELVGE